MYLHEDTTVIVLLTNYLKINNCVLYYEAVWLKLGNFLLDVHYFSLVEIVLMM